MKLYFCSFLIGCVVGVIYASVRMKCPAPPVVALVGLLGMLAGEKPCLGSSHFYVEHTGENKCHKLRTQDSNPHGTWITLD